MPRGKYLTGLGMAQVLAQVLALMLGLVLGVTAPVQAQSSANGDDQEGHRYRVIVDDALSELRVSACLYGRAPGALRAASRDAGRFVSGNVSLRSGAERARATRSGRTISLSRLASGDCVDYRIDLARMTGGSDFRDGFRAGGSVMTNPSLWLFLPYRDHQPVFISFEHASEHGISAPWTLIGQRPGNTRFRIDDVMRDWSSRVAMGAITKRTVVLPGTAIRVAMLDGNPPLDVEDTLRWVRSTAGSVNTLYGRFPLPSPQVTITPIGPRGEPVPWGHVLRGGGAAVHFYVDPTRPAREFEEDWTATHEFSHLLLPYVDRRDAWLSEGLASYYQNVLRGRSGLLSPEKAWERVMAGMQRGQRNTSDRNSLAETSSRMSENGAYRRVYWSGAAYALEVDVELRKRTNDKQSLDTALAGLQSCCLPATRSWRASEVVAKLDEITGTTVFSDIHERYMPMRGFPRLDPLFRELGVRDVGDVARLDDSARSARICKAIMTPSPLM